MDDRIPTADIRNTDELEFAIFCVESLAARLHVEPERVYRALSGESGLLQGYIVPSYDTLHTQGKDYIVDELLELMEQRGVRV